MQTEADRRVPVVCLTECPWAHVVDLMPRAHFIARLPEAELLGPTMALERASAQHEKTRRARLHAESSQVAGIANDRRATLADDAPRREDPDSRHANEEIVRRRHDIERKVRAVCKRPGDFWIAIER